MGKRARWGRNTGAGAGRGIWRALLGSIGKRFGGAVAGSLGRALGRALGEEGHWGSSVRELEEQEEAPERSTGTFSENTESSSGGALRGSLEGGLREEH